MKVSGDGLLCLTDMTGCLAGRILPIVPKKVPFSLELLETGGVEKILVHNAGFAFLEFLVITFPSFMASYLQKLLKDTWASIVEADEDDSSDDNGLYDEEDEVRISGYEITWKLRTGLLDTIAKKMDLKAVMTPTATTWPDTIARKMDFKLS